MAMKGIRVEALLADKKGDLGTISPNATIRDAARVIADMRVGILVVLDEDKKFKGLISERDVARALADHGAEAAALKVTDIATKNVTACRPDTELDFVLEMMRTKHFRHMPVMVGDRIAGIVSMGDILRYLLNEREAATKKSGGLGALFGR